MFNFRQNEKTLKVRPAKVRSHMYILVCKQCKKTMTIYSSPSHGPDKLTSTHYGVCEDCRFEITDPKTTNWSNQTKDSNDKD